MIVLRRSVYSYWSVSAICCTRCRPSPPGWRSASGLVDVDRRRVRDVERIDVEIGDPHGELLGRVAEAQRNVVRARRVVLDEICEQLLDDEAHRHVQFGVERAGRDEVADEPEDAVERIQRAREIALDRGAAGSFAAARKQDDRDVVPLRMAVGKHVHCLQQPREQVGHRAFVARAQHLLDACRAEHRARRVLAFEHAVGDQAEDVARREFDLVRRIDLGKLHEPERKSRGRQPAADAGRSLEMQQRALARRMVIDPVRDRVEHTKERRDEVLFRQVLDQLVVDLGENRVEIGAEPQRDAQHARHLRGAERGPDAVAAGVAEQQKETPLIQRNEIEGVAAGLVCRAELAGHVVLRQLRHFRRQRAHLDFAGELDLAIEFFGLRQGARHALALDEDDALRRERLRHAFVFGREGALLAVDDLQHAHELRAFDERHRQHAADVVVDVEIDGRIEQRFELAIGNVDDLA